MTANDMVATYGAQAVVPGPRASALSTSQAGLFILRFTSVTCPINHS